jgi:lysophospholipase L1-like esterase
MDILKYWTPNGFEISSYKWHLYERVNKTFNGSGSDTSGLCTYTYNDLGFRGDSSTKEGFRIMSLGCSLTEGIGVNDNETWPAQLCSHIPNSVNLNFGVSGRSNDFISRCLLSYFDLIKPDLVLIMYTYPTRKEYYTNLGGVEPFIPGQSWGYLRESPIGHKVQVMKTMLQNDNEDFINWYKNHLLITNFLETKKIPFVWNDSILETSYTDTNKFYFNYQPYLDWGLDGSHPGPEQHKKYAKHLYEYVKQKNLI